MLKKIKMREKPMALIYCAVINDQGLGQGCQTYGSQASLMEKIPNKKKPYTSCFVKLYVIITK